LKAGEAKTSAHCTQRQRSYPHAGASRMAINQHFSDQNAVSDM